MGVLLIQGILLIAIAPLISGIVSTLKARFQGRRGPSVLQKYYNLFKFFRKDMVVADNASWIFHVAPHAVFGVAVLISFLIPVFYFRGVFDTSGDLILMIYLLAIIRFFMIIASLDTGGAFGGMAASREALVSALTEPVILLALIVAAIDAHSLQFSHIIERGLSIWPVQINPISFFGLSAFIIATLAETARMPVDNPVTHLELTMIHEGMLIEYSGRYLALLEWASQIKLLLFFTLMSDFFFPWGISAGGGVISVIFAVIIYIGKVSFMALLLAILESRIAKLRLFRVPEFTGVGLVMGFLGLLSYYFLG